MKYLCIPEEYEQEGEKKVKWNRIGETFKGRNGKEYVKLYHIPGTLIHAFEPQKKEQNQDIEF